MDPANRVYKTLSVDCVFALDGMWYHRHGDNDNIDVIKLGPDQKKVFFQKSLISDYISSDSALLVFPTLDANRAIVSMAEHGHLSIAYLIHVKATHAKVVRTFDTSFVCAKFKDGFKLFPDDTFYLITKKGRKWHEVTDYKVEQYMPYCARYRLYTEKRHQQVRVFMMILNTNGETEEYVQVYKLKCSKNAPQILHTASNEEVSFHYLNCEPDQILFLKSLFPFIGKSFDYPA